MSKIRVAVNGHGVIGRHVNDVAVQQEEMELLGVTRAVGNDSSRSAEVRGRWKPNENMRARNRHLDKLRLRRKARHSAEKKFNG